jgi:hypothetical protein
MALIETLEDLITSTDQIHVSSINEFLPLDIKNIQKKLKIAERATENGSRELPSSESDDIDDVENIMGNNLLLPTISSAFLVAVRMPL